jgi:penicillin V acylase-like amidase (Ntn superfamily)
MNEAGLSATTLYLKDTDYGDRDVNRPGLVLSLWPQYILDNFSTVVEAVQALTEKNIQIIPLNLPPGVKIPLHMAIADATGDSAIIEIINGQFHVYHDRDYTVMTNQPTYDQQLANLSTYIEYKPTLTPPYQLLRDLPGSLKPMDRLVRAYYYGHIMYKPQNQNQAASYMLGLLGNIAIPSNMNADDFPTWWASVMNLTHGVFYFNSMNRPNVVWVDMSKLNFNPHALEREFDVEWGPANVFGDITNLLRLRIAKPFVFKDSSDYNPGPIPD